MARIGKITLLIMFCLLGVASAGDVVFNASTDKTTVALDDTLQYTLEVSGSNVISTPSPTLPQFTNVTVVGSSQSSNISIINGQVNVSKSFIYTLQPQKIGSAYIDSASITVNGQRYMTNPINISVTKAEGGKSQPQTGAGSRPSSIWDDFDDFFNSPSPHFRRQEVVTDPIKVDLKASLTNAYVNQQIVLTFTFYRRVNLSQAPSYVPPDTTGFWAIDLPADKEPREVELNGNRYLAQDFKTALFATTAGNFTIGPASLMVQTSPFVPAETIKTNPIKINILPLPDKGKPKNYTGAVGNYQMKVSLKQNRVEKGQPVQITARIWGQGNIQTIAEPISLLLPGYFKKLSASGKEDLIKGKDGISGSKTFDIVLIPLKEGKFTLPPFEFSYFDPLKKEYRTLKSQSLSLNILPSSVPLPREYEEALAKEANKKPVAIIIPWGKIFTTILRVVTSIYFWLPAIIILFVLITLFIYKKYQKKLEADPSKLRQRQALRVARNRLKKAFRLLKQHQLKEFLGEIFNATARYLGDKYGFSAVGITTERLKEILNQRGLSLEVQQELENFINECDMLRFTPSSLGYDRAEQLSQLAEKLIVMVERG